MGCGLQGRGMRFASDGPDIPGDLLYARDEGDVLFFCGAGVSRAEAGGPTFRELAERVVDGLGSARESPARRLLEFSTAIEVPPGVGGIPPADRIFALLEQEFAIHDVRAAVARAVAPKENPGLGPHRSLLDLSRAPDGKVRLVTTNFDRVFQLARPDLAEILPPALPDPRRPGAVTGIVHLHGMVTPDYDGAASGEFVLSSADFGRAYLSEGWATTFMRALLERYRIVFVGYSADDPPIQYLLEALSRSTPSDRLYAFHPGDAGQAAALWRHKGVTAIPFQGFDTLWQSLGQWASRARSPAEWQASIIVQAQRGPRALEAYERGQVAHLVSSDLGSRAFSRGDPAPPAEWLCVFDPAVRYDRERRLEGAPRFEPFEAYRLDDDLPPAAAGLSSSRSFPLDAWSGLDALPADRVSVASRAVTGIRGPHSVVPGGLTMRLESLARWFGRVAGDGVAVWWAAGQQGLHPSLRDAIRNAISARMSSTIRTAWRLLLSAPEPADRDDMSVYDLQRILQEEGWSDWALRELEAIERPHITIRRALTAPPLDGEPTLGQMLHKDVAFPGHLSEIVIPDTYLARYIRDVRRHLEMAETLEQEGTGFFFMICRPITPFVDAGSDFYERGDDLPALIRYMANLLERLAKIDPSAAQAEMRAWPGVDDAVFKLLRVWAAGQQSLMPAADAASFYVTLSDETFWEQDVQRDLLIGLRRRWGGLTAEDKALLVARIVTGPPFWDGADPERYRRYHAHQILSRLHWIEREGLDVEIDLAKARAKPLEILPDWSAEDGNDEIYQSRSRGGWVATDLDHEPLLTVPLDELLDTAAAAAGRRRDVLVEHQPFRGLAAKRPIRALAALVRAAERGETRISAWSDLLWQEVRKTDRPGTKRVIAARLAALPEPVFEANRSAIGEWLGSCGKALFAIDSKAYRHLWDRISRSFVTRAPTTAPDSAEDEPRYDWMTGAINAPAGKIATLFCDEPFWVTPEAPRPEDDWTRRGDLLLSFEGRALEHVAAIFGSRLSALIYFDQDWATRAIFDPLLVDPHSRPSQAAFACALRYDSRWSKPMFLKMKPLLLERIAHPDAEESEERSVPVALLRGWNTIEDGARLVTDAEMREALIGADDAARLSVANGLSSWMREEPDWDATIHFLEHVWPRQLVARSPRISGAFAGIAMEAGDEMPRVTAAVLPLLSPASEGWDDRIVIRRSDDVQTERFPFEHLSLLTALLAPDACNWAYGAFLLIERLSQIDAVRDDPRLVELRRRAAMR